MHCAILKFPHCETNTRNSLSFTLGETLLPRPDLLLELQQLPFVVVGRLVFYQAPPTVQERAVPPVWVQTKKTIFVTFVQAHHSVNKYYLQVIYEIQIPMYLKFQWSPADKEQRVERVPTGRESQWHKLLTWGTTCESQDFESVRLIYSFSGGRADKVLTNFSYSKAFNCYSVPSADQHSGKRLED